MSDDDVTVPITCEACDTRTSVPLSDLPEAVESHNERLHDGESIAQVDPELTERIADLAAADVVEEQ